MYKVIFIWFYFMEWISEYMSYLKKSMTNVPNAKSEKWIELLFSIVWKFKLRKKWPFQHMKNEKQINYIWILKTFSHLYSINNKHTDYFQTFDSKEIKPVHPRENHHWIFIGRTDTETKAPILWPPDVKSWLIGKDHAAGKDWRREEKGMTEDEIVGWHHWLNGHEFEQASGDAEGQGSLVCCNPWGYKQLDMTEWWNNKYFSESQYLKASIFFITVLIYLQGPYV